MNRRREEIMKFVRWIALIPMFVCVTGCVGLAPIYDTAITHKGFTVGGGIGYHQYEVESSSGIIHIHDGLKGIRPDIALSYNLTNWFSLVGRVGMIIGTDIPQGEPAQEPSFGLGLKFSTPWKIFNLALRAEADYPRLASLTPMMGFSTRKGHEIVTVGIQTAFGIAPTGAFVSLHPFRGSHIFAAAGENELCLGIGYTYHFPKKNKGDETKME